MKCYFSSYDVSSIQSISLISKSVEILQKITPPIGMADPVYHMNMQHKYLENKLSAIEVFLLPAKKFLEAVVGSKVDLRTLLNICIVDDCDFHPILPAQCSAPSPLKFFTTAQSPRK